MSESFTVRITDKETNTVTEQKTTSLRKAEMLKYGIQMVNPDAKLVEILDEKGEIID